MSNFPFLLLLLLLPLAGAILVTVIGRDPQSKDLAKKVAVGASLLELLLAILMWVSFKPTGPRLQFVTSFNWITAIGAKFSLGTDGIALVMLVLIALLVPIVMIASWNHNSLGDEINAPDSTDPQLAPSNDVARLFAWILVLEVCMVGVFAATDVFLFYIFFEIMLVPMYFIIGGYGASQRRAAAMKFFIYSLVGGLVMLASVIGLYVISKQDTGKPTFSWDALRQLDLSHTQQVWIFLGFFVAFAIKAPLVPFHTWLPKAGAEGPVGGSVLLLGILDKVGTFGFLRYCLPIAPWASQKLAPLVLVLAVIGIIYGAFQAIGADDIKRLVTYTSIAHFGFIVLGIFAFTTQAGTGAVLYMVNHGISTGMMFLVVGMVVARGGSRRVRDYGGIFLVAPLLAGFFVIAGMASLALPGTNSFVSEFLVLIGSYGTEPVFTIIATGGIVMSALYVLWLIQRTLHGPESPLVVARKKLFGDLSKRELWVLSPLVALILVFGVYPKPITDVIKPAVEATLHTDVGVKDPVPTVGAAAISDGGSK
ncbi:MAG: NADH-quinone oxidoreductase subunit M [Antricoccus sp.]